MIIKGIAIILTGIISLPLIVLLGEGIGRFFTSDILPMVSTWLSAYADSWKHVWCLVTGRCNQGVYLPVDIKGGEQTVKYFYLSLTRGLNGYYVKFEAENEEAVSQHAAKYFGRMYGSVYTDAYFHEVVRKRFPSASRVINNQRPIKLTGEPGEWE